MKEENIQLGVNALFLISHFLRKLQVPASTFLSCPPQLDRNFGDFRQANPQIDSLLKQCYGVQGV